MFVARLQFSCYSSDNLNPSVHGATLPVNWGRWCQKQVSQTGIRNCMPLWDAISYPCLRYLLLAPKSSNNRWTYGKSTYLCILLGMWSFSVISTIYKRFKCAIRARMFLFIPCKTRKCDARIQIITETDDWLFRSYWIIVLHGAEKILN